MLDEYASACDRVEEVDWGSEVLTGFAKYNLDQDAR